LKSRSGFFGRIVGLCLRGGSFLLEDLVKALYRDILSQVLLLEIQKKAAAEGILVLRSDKERLPFIKEYLELDLNKHQLLEQAAVSALQNNDPEVLDHLARLYPFSGEKRPVIDIIRSEIDYEQRLTRIIERAIKYPENITFFERRILQEISKLMVEQAREYLKVDFSH
jgi:hypothetical protein